MKGASRTVGVVAGGVAGFAVGGPGGAVAGGIVGGAAMDGITTGIDSAVHNEYRRAGTVANVTALVKNPKDPGLWYDTNAGITMDGIGGLMGREGVSSAKVAVGEGLETFSQEYGRVGVKRSKQPVGKLNQGGGKAEGGSKQGESGGNSGGGGGGGGGREGGASGGNGGKKQPSGSNDPPRGDDGPGKKALEAWYKAANDIVFKIKKEYPMETVDDLIDFLKKIGYEKKKRAGASNKKSKGSHVKYELQDKTKFNRFIEQEMGYNGFDIDSIPHVGATVSVAITGMRIGTIKGVLDRVFGLDDLGQ